MTTTTIESDAIWCPTNRVGNQCPEETLLSFYKCCGHLNKECCFHMRVWIFFPFQIVIMIIVLPICLVLPATTFLIRRLLCASSQPTTGRAPSAADRVRQLAAEDSTTFRRDSDDMVML
uniref:Transmembrane protein n=1 Tax=Caenorhabditis tropicalis TaxID=1561998 RepID=A0A1I7V0E9_9PELO